MRMLYMVYQLIEKILPSWMNGLSLSRCVFEQSNYTPLPHQLSQVSKISDRQNQGLETYKNDWASTTNVIIILSSLET